VRLNIGKEKQTGSNLIAGAYKKKKVNEKGGEMPF
jgi:hypothetical protein